MRVLARKVAEEWVFVASLLGLLASSLALHRLPHYTPDDFHVAFVLFVFLVIIRGLEKSHLLTWLAVKLSAEKHLALRLVFLTGALSTFVTNDVALMVVVPLTLALDIEGVEKIVILETIAANGASALTPFGNPQNLFIYYHFGLHAGEFVGAIFPFALVSLAFAMLMASTIKARPMTLTSPAVGRDAYLYLAFFTLFLLAALKLLPLWVGAIPLLYVLVRDRAALRVDYFLLFTFLCFFGFTDNLTHVLRFELQSPTSVFVYSVLASQLISNVPSTLLLADFTSNWRALLWGVSVGGFGTLLGSLASLISYKLYLRRRSEHRHYLAKFHAYSFAALALGILIYFALKPGG